MLDMISSCLVSRNVFMLDQNAQVEDHLKNSGGVVKKWM